MRNGVDGRSDAIALGEELATSYLERRLRPAGWRDRLDGIDMAYEVQDALVASFIEADGGAVAGYKVGLTSKAMQTLCGIDVPIFGRVLERGIVPSGAVLRRDSFERLGIESELALRIGRDVTVPLDGSDADILRFVDSVHAAFEVVDDRNADYSRLVAPEIVAENSWNAGIVLAEGVATHRIDTIDAIRGTYCEDDRDIASGYTTDVLGSPLNVLRWLARFLLDRGSRLRAGDVVVTGSIVATRFPDRPTVCRFVLDGLPGVEARVA